MINGFIVLQGLRNAFRTVDWSSIEQELDVLREAMPLIFESSVGSYAYADLVETSISLG